MIVEFCKYGNLSNYLRSKRDDFVVCKVSLEVSADLLDGSRPGLILNCACVVQRQDGKGVSSISGIELSELMKRRLESVASTGSSASSGFIEDKSYCDSEEEEEGTGQTRLASLQRPHPSSPLFVLPRCRHPLTPAPPLLHRNEAPLPPAAPLDCCWAWAWWDVSSSCSAVQSLQWEPMSPHWVWGGDCLFPVLTWLLLCSRASAQARHLSRVMRWCVIFGLISYLLRWAGGRTPCEFLQHQDAGATFHLSYERHE